MLFGNEYNKISVECGQQVMFRVTGTVPFKIWVQQSTISSNKVVTCNFVVFTDVRSSVE